MKKNSRVMVVDNEKNIQYGLLDYLDSMGYDIVTANDGDEALAKFQKGKFDLIISDFLKTSINGLEFLKRIHELDRDVIFLMVTGYPPIDTGLNTVKGFIWTLLFSIPAWLIFGIILMKLLR